jgi:hypothetical protein
LVYEASAGLSKAYGFDGIACALVRRCSTTASPRSATTATVETTTATTMTVVEDEEGGEGGGPPFDIWALVTVGLEAEYVTGWLLDAWNWFKPSMNSAFVLSADKEALKVLTSAFGMVN